MGNLAATRPADVRQTSRMGAPSSFTRRHRFGVYVAGAFAISWTGVLAVAWSVGFEFPTEESVLPLLAAMLPGPPVSALAVTAVADGRAGLRALGRRLATWRLPGRSYAFLLVMPAVVLTVLSVMGWLVDDAYAPRFDVTFILIGAVAGLFEELGWTGVATPALLRRQRPLAAGLLLGGIWSVWHVLADAIGNQQDAALGALWFPRFATVFVVGLIAWRVVMTFVYRQTGSLFLGVLLHGFYTGSLGAFMPEVSDGQYVASTAVMAVALCLVAAAMVIVDNRDGG